MKPNKQQWSFYGVIQQLAMIFLEFILTLLETLKNKTICPYSAQTLLRSSWRWISFKFWFEQIKFVPMELIALQVDNVSQLHPVPIIVVHTKTMPASLLCKRN